MECGARTAWIPTASCRPELRLGFSVCMRFRVWVDGATWPEFLQALAQEQEGLDLGGVDTGPQLPLP